MYIYISVNCLNINTLNLLTNFILSRLYYIVNSNYVPYYALFFVMF